MVGFRSNPNIEGPAERAQSESVGLIVSSCTRHSRLLGPVGDAVRFVR